MSTRNVNSKSSSTPRPSSAPKRNTGRRVHRLGPQSRLQDVSGGHTCTDRITELVLCHRGYSSMALYAVFSIFIVAFLYVIWKLVSTPASRSGHTRRPGSANSTSPTKITPAAHSLAGNMTSPKWMQHGRVGWGLGQVVHEARPKSGKGKGSKRFKVHANGENIEGKEIHAVKSHNEPPWFINSGSTPAPSTSGPSTKAARSHYLQSDRQTSPHTGKPSTVDSKPTPADFDPISGPKAVNDYLEKGEATAWSKRLLEGIHGHDASAKREWRGWEAKRIQMPGASHPSLPYTSYKKPNNQDDYYLNYDADTGYREVPPKPRFGLASTLDGDSDNVISTMNVGHQQRNFPSKPEERHYFHRTVGHREHHSRKHSEMYGTYNFKNGLDEGADQVGRSFERDTGGDNYDQRTQTRVRYDRPNHHRKAESSQEKFHREKQASRYRHNHRGYAENKDGHESRVRFPRPVHHKEVEHSHNRQEHRKRHFHYGYKNKDGHESRVRFRRPVHHKDDDHSHKRQEHRKRHFHYGYENEDGHESRVRFRQPVDHKQVDDNREHIYRVRHRHHHHGYRNNHHGYRTNHHGYRTWKGHRTSPDERDRRVRKPRLKKIIQYHKKRPVHRLAKHVFRRRKRKRQPKKHSTSARKHEIPKPVYQSRQRARVHVLGYRRYLQYRRHHSFQEESRGGWRKSRHRVRTCKTLHTFTTAGTVKLSRTKYHSKFLYTLLVCKPVKFRIHRHGRKLKVRRAQLCHNKWYITRGLLHVKNTIGSAGLPSYSVRLCTHSYVREMLLKARAADKAKRGRTKSRHSPRKVQHQRHHRHRDQRRRGHKSRKKNKDKKITAHKHLKKGFKKKQNKLKKLRRKSWKHRHVHHLRRKIKEAGKKSGSRNGFVRHNTSEKSNATKSSSGNEFFLKLLRVLKLAKQNQTKQGDVVGSLEHAVELILENPQNSSHHKNGIKNGSKNETKNSSSLSGFTANSTNISKDFIQEVLAKVLPYVLQSVKADGKSQGRLRVPTTKPSTKTETTTISKPTQTTTPKPTNQTTKATHSTVQPSGSDMAAVLKNLIPLLLKAQQARVTEATTTKAPTTKTTVATTQPKSKKLRELLASLGLGSLDLGSLEDAGITKPTVRAANKVQSTKQSTSPTTPAAKTLPTTRRTPAPPPTPPPTRPPPLSPPPPPRAPSAWTPNQNVVRPPDPFTKHVLCFGDSLTSGFYNHGKNSHPYSTRLNQLLNSNGGGLHYHVDTSGKVGEMVHGSMTKRLPMVLGNTSRVDWAVILGGTNDVAHVKNFGDDDSFMNQLISVWKPKIVQDILSLHQTAYKFGARTVLLTIPESAYEAWPSFKTLWVMRTAINQDLRAFARRSGGRTVLCDLAIKLPRHTLTPQAQALLWNDHLHLTPYGYDRMADIVYQCLKPHLRK